MKIFNAMFFLLFAIVTTMQIAASHSSLPSYKKAKSIHDTYLKFAPPTHTVSQNNLMKNNIEQKANLVKSISNDTLVDSDSVTTGVSLSTPRTNVSGCTSPALSINSFKIDYSIFNIDHMRELEDKNQALEATIKKLNKGALDYLNLLDTSTKKLAYTETQLVDVQRKLTDREKKNDQILCQGIAMGVVGTVVIGTIGGILVYSKSKQS